MIEVLRKNPFVVLTPDERVSSTNSLTDSYAEIEDHDKIPAKVVHKLFVPVFEDFSTIPQQGHVFINGPRGSGKSMMFRFMLPDCQLIEAKASFYDELPYFSIHIPIKATSINNPEFEAVKDYGDAIFNEHALTIFFAESIFKSLSLLDFTKVRNAEKLVDAISNFYVDSFIRRLKQSGWVSQENMQYNPQTPQEAFSLIADFCFDIFSQTLQYLKRNVPRGSHYKFEQKTYEGPLTDYLNFLFPILKDLRKIGIFPSGPFFLLVDDADNLTETQTTVLNTWVSYRTNSDVSLKISTQLKYKTYNTIYGTNIDSPHDYYDINIQTTYSSARSLYENRIEQIVQRRLDHFFEGIYQEGQITVQSFFPRDNSQVLEIEKEKEKIKEKHHEEGVSNRVHDDVTRYAVPNFIASLKESRATSTYSYSGFDQLVSISSGVIRHFLTPAGKMFNAQLRKNRIKGEVNPLVIKQIEPEIQNEVIREYSTWFVFDDYDNLKKNKRRINSEPDYLDNVNKLRNLIEGLGSLFHEYLIDRNRTERRYFSFAISDKPDKELNDVLELGVQEGYFQKSTIGKKRGSGKTRLYILNRIMAPNFTLDPSGYAAYKFFTNEKLKLALYKPDTFKETLSKLRDIDEDFSMGSEAIQGKLDFNSSLDF